MSAAVARSRPIPSRDAVTAAAAAALAAAIVAAIARQLAHGAIMLPVDRSVWLAIHVGTVTPALPLGAYVLFGRKGDRRHRMLGRAWALLMVAGALSSFGLHGLIGHLSPIDLLSVITLVGILRGVLLAMRGDIARHRRTMLRVYTGLVLAGAFAFLPGRLFGIWLFS
jgi:uncharacterized membrane protein